MEDLVIEIVADQESRVGDEDKTGFVAALPRHPSDHVGSENPRGDDDKVLPAQAPAADVAGDLFHNIESLKKDDALTRLFELEERQEKNFFEMGGVLSVI